MGKGLKHTFLQINAVSPVSFLKVAWTDLYLNNCEFAIINSKTQFCHPRDFASCTISSLIQVPYFIRNFKKYFPTVNQNNFIFRCHFNNNMLRTG